MSKEKFDLFPFKCLPFGLTDQESAYGETVIWYFIIFLKEIVVHFANAYSVIINFECLFKTWSLHSDRE